MPEARLMRTRKAYWPELDHSREAQWNRCLAIRERIQSGQPVTMEWLHKERINPTRFDCHE